MSISEQCIQEISKFEVETGRQPNVIFMPPIIYDALITELKGGNPNMIFVGPVQVNGVTCKASIWVSKIYCSRQPGEMHVGPACECGKDKHGFSNHTQWCPKYES